MQISFGDNVKVRELPTTKAEGVAGLIGNVRGETTPSVTNVHVIGDLKEDYALNVYFEDRDECFWFTPDQLDFIDHAVGTEITLNDVSKKWVRNKSGRWHKISTGDMHQSFWKIITRRVFGRK